MSLIDLSTMDLENVSEPTPVPGDEEYELRILEVILKENKNGEPYIMPRFEVIGHPTAKDFGEYIPLPHSGMDPKKMERSKYRLKLFLTTFNLPLTTSLDIEDMVGSTGWAILGVESDEQYGDSNKIKRFLPPR